MQLFQQNYFKYGMVMVFITILCLVVMEFSGNNAGYDPNSPLFFFYQWIAPLTVWYFGIRARKKELKNKLTFRLGVLEGFKMGLVFAVVSPFVFLSYYTLVNPQIVEWLRHGSTEPTWIIIGKDMLLQFVVSVPFGILHGAMVTPLVMLGNKKNKKQ